MRLSMTKDQDLGRDDGRGNRSELRVQTVQNSMRDALLHGNIQPDFTNNMPTSVSLASDSKLHHQLYSSYQDSINGGGTGDEVTRIWNEVKGVYLIIRAIEAPTPLNIGLAVETITTWRNADMAAQYHAEMVELGDRIQIELSTGIRDTGSPDLPGSDPSNPGPTVTLASSPVGGGFGGNFGGNSGNSQNNGSGGVDGDGHQVSNIA